MPKPPDDIQDLKRRLALLGRLGGRALVCAEGTHLFEVAGARDTTPPAEAPRRGRPVRDAAALVDACRAGRPALAAVRAAIDLSSPPLPITPSLLAAAQRDLRVLAGPRVAGVLRGAARIFRRHGDIDAAWLAAKQARLDQIVDAPRAAAALDAGRGPLPPWFERVLELVALVHGDEAAAVVCAAAIPDTSTRAGAGAPPRERPRASGLDGAARRAARDRSTGPDERERLLTFLAHASLTFDPRPRDGRALCLPRKEIDIGPGDGGALALSRKDIALGPDGIRALAERFDQLPLRLPEALALARLELRGEQGTIARLVSEGLPIGHVERLVQLGRAKDLVKLRSGVEGAVAYAEWTSTLVPHYASLGLDLPLTPELFERLRTAHRSDLAVLAVCLMKHHAKAEPDTAEQALARLDATLALFERRPAEIASILAELSGTTPGAGRAVMPEIADWLADDALLDRHVHLCRIAGVPAALSRTLRADFERGQALARERDHLASLRARSPVQEARLARLAAGQVAVPPPDRTRRRIAERARELLARAYEARLDAALRRIAKDAWGITVPRLTPGWRDAIRFYLVVEKNRELLGTVLRAAASGADLARALPRNQAWIASVAGRFDVDAWLAPRSRDVDIGGQRHRLSVERDPIEVLRMGIPFDTCLSLEGGSNAASTVVNAADANKRVLYLRDARGSIVARKLIAVSREHTLLGYHLYIGARDHVDEITGAFREMCAHIAQAARLPLARTGKPKQIHPGFWYDDGAVPFDEPPPREGAVSAYCRALGMPVPSTDDGDLATAARVFAAVQSGSVDEVCAQLADGWLSWEHRRAAAWVVDRLDPERLVVEARRSSAIARVAVERAAERGPVPMLKLAARIASWESARIAGELFPRFPLDPQLAFARVAAAIAASRSGVKYDSDGLEHRTMDALPEMVQRLPIAAGLALCDRAEPLLRFIAGQPECTDCPADARRRIIDALVVAYAGARDPSAVIERLGGRSRPLARRAALAIAARYALTDDAIEPTMPPPRVEPVRPCPAALRALVKLRRRAPELEREPDLLAAVVRQAGGVPRGIDLPVPGEPPFEALADLLAQLDLAEILAPWTSGRGDPHKWSPGPWELHHHRRNATGLRAQIAEEARAAFAADPLGAASQEALQRVAQLGDAGVIFPLLDAAARGPGGVRVRARLDRARVLAQEITGQAASSRAADPIEAELARRGKGRPKTRTDAYDQGLLLAAVAEVERRISTGPIHREPIEEERLRVALSILGEADKTGRIRHPMASLLIARRGDRVTAEDHPICAAFWGACSAGNLAVPAEVALVHFEDEELRDRWVLSFLLDGALGSAEQTYEALAALARRTGRAHLIPVLFDEIVSALIHRGRLDFLDTFDDEAQLRRAVRLVFAEGVAARTIASYKHLHAHARAAVFLQELADSPLRTSDALRTEVRLWRESIGPHVLVLLEWLEACLAGTAPAPKPHGLGATGRLRVT